MMRLDMVSSDDPPVSRVFPLMLAIALVISGRAGLLACWGAIRAGRGLRGASLMCHHQAAHTWGGSGKTRARP